MSSEADAIELLRELVAIPSLSGQEAEATAFLVDRMAQWGLSARLDAAGNAVGVRECRDAAGQIRQEIILLGHIDTVPGAIPVRLEDGRLYGRGTVDAKGPLATFVVAAAGASLPAGTRIVVIGAVEEEAASSRGAYYAANQYRPDYCLIGEPSGWDGVTLGYKGRLLLDYHHRQPMTHSAGPESGAAERGIAWWNQLNEEIDHLNAGRARLFDQILPALRHIASDSDGIQNEIDIQAGLRLPPDFDVDAFLARAQALAGPAAVRGHSYEPAFQSTRSSPLARAFNVALRAVDARPRFKVKTGTSDMNVVGPRWHCPIVAYGPGDSRLDHTPDEHLIIAEYLRAIAVLQDVLQLLVPSGAPVIPGEENGSE